MVERKTRGFWALLLGDLRPHWTHTVRPGLRPLRFVYNLAAFSGVHALLVFRVAQICTRLYLYPISYVCRKVLYHWYHMDVWGDTEIGEGHWWCHPIGVVYSRHARFGRRVQVFQGVSVVSGAGGSPVIGDFVTIFANACVIGGVRVGRGAIIGAHSVVTRDVSDYNVVAGNPARFVRERFLGEIDSADSVGRAVCKPGAKNSSRPAAGEE